MRTFDDTSRSGPPSADALRALARWCGAGPGEVAGLLVVVVSALAATAVLWWQAAPTRIAVPRDPAPVPVITPAPSAVPGPVLVHVAGAVAVPGVVTVPPGSRVIDAVAAAGGALPGADLSRLNLARQISDGERITIPRVGQPLATPRPHGTAGGSASGSGSELVDVNHAGQARLEELPGIGPVLAERIISWREEHGPFEDVASLQAVPGIGDRTVELLAEQATAGWAPPHARAGPCPPVAPVPGTFPPQVAACYRRWP